MSLSPEERSRASELLPWFLNDTLSDDERSFVQRALERDASLRRELGEVAAVAEVFTGSPDTATLVAAAAGELGSQEQAAVERYLEHDPLAVELVAAAREDLVDAQGPSPVDAVEMEPPGSQGANVDGVAPGALGDTGRDTVVPFRPRESSAGGLWRGLALAATVLAMLSLWGWLRSGPAPSSEVAAVTLVELLPDDMVLRGGEPDAAELVSADAERVVVILVTEISREFEGYAARVVGTDGNPVQTVSASRAADGTVSLLLPRALLESSGSITLLGQNGDDEEELHTYSWSGES